jgi:hypothetical protein
MALNPHYSNTAVNAEANALAVLFNNGYLRIYDGTQPANADTAVGAQNLLAELRFAATAFGAAVAGVITANAMVNDTDANATGTASWFRALQSDGTTSLYDGSAGTSASDLVMPTVAIQQHAEVDVTSLTITIQK